MMNRSPGEHILISLFPLQVYGEIPKIKNFAVFQHFLPGCPARRGFSLKPREIGWLVL